ncbi:MAG TPA: ribosome maturation factor [Ferruginibacter sp.]|nr:ribosome maturation factor [Ferruginibacter sp.]
MQRTKKQMKGTEAFPSSFIMTQDSHIQTVEKLIGPLLQEDVFLVSVKIKPTNNIKIYLDADGGLGIEKCIRINRALYKVMEEKGLYPDGDFSLEVSSPGIDEPLKLLRQYKKNIGRNVEVTTLDEAKKEGRLTGVSEDGIIIEYTTGKGKKAETKQEEISFDNIKQTKVLVKF